jgi:hypothetical protein
VAGEHGLGGGLKLGRLTLEVGARAALGLAGIRGQLDAVDGKHLAADEALPVAQVEHLAEQTGDVVGQPRDEGGNGSEMRRRISREGDERDVLAAGALNAARTDDALAVGEQYDLEQHPRRVGRRTDKVVAVAGVEAGEVEPRVDKVMQRVLESAGQQLPFKIDRNEARAGVDVLVARHAQAPLG